MNDMTSAVLARVTSGDALTREQRDWVLTTPDIVQVGLIASEVRRARVGEQATFVRVDEVPVAQAQAWTVVPEAGEVRITGQPASLAEAISAVEALAAQRGASVTGFTLHDVAAAAGGDLQAGLRALREAGLVAIAEARADRLDDEWLAAVADAGLCVQAVAPGWAVIGEAWLGVLAQVAAVQTAFGVFQSFRPLAAEASVTEPSTGYDDLRAVATARLLLPAPTRLQVHWRRAGAKLAQACLLFGANDVDAVPARDPMPHGPRRAILEEVRRNILAVSMTPVERTARFTERAAAGAEAPA